MNKEVGQYLGLLGELKGVHIAQTKGSHFSVFLDDRKVGTIPGTPSDHRWKRNSISQLKKAGLDIFSHPRKEQRAAGGQSPPPLPVITIPLKEVKVGRTFVPNPEHYVNEAKRVTAEVREHFELQPRAGRVLAHGTAPKLVKIAEAWVEQTGTPVPHMNYMKRDTSDRHDMIRLAVEKLMDLAAYGVLGKGVTDITSKQVNFVVSAWGWYVERGYTTKPEELPVVAQLPEPEVKDREIPTIEPSEWQAAKVQEAPEPELVQEVFRRALASSNGLTRDENLVLRLVAKLAFNGAGEQEAVEMGVEVYDALRR